MWKSKSVREHIVEIESKNAVGLHKKDILKILTSRWNSLKNSKIHYESQDRNSRERPAPRKVAVSDSQNEVFGCVPLLEKTVCSLMTIDICKDVAGLQLLQYPNILHRWKNIHR